MLRRQIQKVGGGSKGKGKIYLGRRCISPIAGIKLKEIIRRIIKYGVRKRGRDKERGAISKREKEIVFEEDKIDDNKKKQNPKDRNKRSYGAKIISRPIHVGIIGNSTRHSCQA